MSKKDIPYPICRSELSRSSESRFRVRAAHPGSKDSLQLWGEAAQQVRKGWITPPVPLHADGRQAQWWVKQFNIAFRFGVDQADKLRTCDDLRRSVANLACSVVTPVRLVSWDHLAQMPRIVAEKKVDWGLIKADHEAAYMRLSSTLLTRHAPSSHSATPHLGNGMVFRRAR